MPTPPPRSTSRSVPFLVSVTGGLTLWASFYFPPLVWIGLAPVALLVRLSSPRRWLYSAAYAGGLAHYLPGVAWIRLSDPDAFLAWLALAAYMACYYPGFVLAARILNRRWNVPLLFSVPIAWVAMEYIRMHLMTGFGWLFLAHSLYRWTTIIQISDLMGAYGVSFLIAMVNAFWIEVLTLPLFVPGKGKTTWAIRWRAAATAGAVMGASAYGVVRIGQADFTEGPKIALAQTNIRQALKQGDAESTFDDIREITVESASLNADMIAWPETSFPYLFGEVDPSLSDLELDRLRIDRRYRYVEPKPEEPTASSGAELRYAVEHHYRVLSNLSAYVRCPVLIGVVREVYRPGVAMQYNASALFAPRAGMVAYYDKAHLVPFGEYLPLEESFPYLVRLTPYEPGYDFRADPSYEYRTLHYKKLNFAALICFEDTTPYVGRTMRRHETAAAPIDFFVSQCNDGWYQNSMEGYYHLAPAVFRCVEFRRAMARICNPGENHVPAEPLLLRAAEDRGGISGLIDGNGAIVSTFPSDRRGALLVTIPVDRRNAPYVVVGDWLPISCLGISMIGALAASVQLILHARRIWRDRHSPAES